MQEMLFRKFLSQKRSRNSERRSVISPVIHDKVTKVNVQPVRPIFPVVCCLIINFSISVVNITFEYMTTCFSHENSCASVKRIQILFHGEWTQQHRRALFPRSARLFPWHHHASLLKCLRKSEAQNSDAVHQRISAPSCDSVGTRQLSTHDVPQALCFDHWVDKPACRDLYQITVHANAHKGGKRSNSEATGGD